MSFSLAAKHVRPRNLVGRYVSTKVAHKAPSHRTLPSAKMRALISLYHQADSFITPENLSQRIDEAFLPGDPETHIKMAVTVKDLEDTLAQQRAAPKLSQWEHGSPSRYADPESTSWSSRRTTREQKVIEALYGVDMSQPNAILPGLEVLRESKEAIEKAIREDLEAEELEAPRYNDPLEKA